MKAEPFERVPAAPVGQVADDGVPQLGQLNADLPAATRPESEFEKRGIRASLQHTVMSDRPFRCMRGSPV
jgi:hypothetical protein